MAARKKTTGRALAAWQREAAERAQAQAAEIPIDAGLPFIGMKAGDLYLGETQLAPKSLVIVVGLLYENQYFKGAYEEGNTDLPICTAAGANRDALAPMAECPEPQAETCLECWANKFGSADKGKGKACANKARLLLLAGDDHNAIANGTAQVVGLRIPPTGQPLLGQYRREVNEELGMPLEMAVATLDTELPKKGSLQKVPVLRYAHAVQNQSVYEAALATGTKLLPDFNRELTAADYAAQADRAAEMAKTKRAASRTGAKKKTSKKTAKAAPRRRR